MFLLKVGVVQNVLIAASAVTFQLLIISWASRISTDYVAAIGLIELVITWAVTVFFFGGEQYFVNFIHKYHCTNYKKIVQFLLGTVFIVMVSVYAFFVVLDSIYFDFLIKNNGVNFVQFHTIATCALFSVFISILVAYFRGCLNITLALLCEKSYVVVFSTILAILFLVSEVNQGIVLENDIIFDVAVVACIASFVFWFLYFLKSSSASCDVSEKDKPSSRCLSFSDDFVISYVSKEGKFFYLTALVVLIFERIDQVVLIAIFGISELAGYYACYKLSFAVRFITKTINTSIYPYLSDLVCREKQDDFFDLYRVSRLVNFTIAFVFTSVLYLFSEQILSLLFAREFVEYKLVLEVMAVALLFSALNQVDFNFLNAQGNSKLFFTNSLVTVCVQLVCIFLLYTSLGLIALVFSRLVASVVGHLFASWNLKEYKVSIFPSFACFGFLMSITIKVFS